LSGPDELLQAMTQLLQETRAPPRLSQGDDDALLDDTLSLGADLDGLAHIHHTLNLRADSLDLLDLAHPRRIHAISHSSPSRQGLEGQDTGFLLRRRTQEAREQGRRVRARGGRGAAEEIGFVARLDRRQRARVDARDVVPADLVREDEADVALLVALRGRQRRGHVRAVADAEDVVELDALEGSDLFHVPVEAAGVQGRVGEQQDRLLKGHGFDRVGVVRREQRPAADHLLVLVGHDQSLADVDGLLAHLLHRHRRVAAHHVGFEILKHQL
jgi:hypothetical protein